jgi:Pentapeptide repeats (8 copies)
MTPPFMTDPEVSFEVFTPQQEALVAAPATPLSEPTPALHHGAETLPNPPAEERSGLWRLANRVAGAAFFTGYLLLSGARPAEASPTETVTAQALSQESGFDWNLIPLATGAVTGVIAVAAFIYGMREKTANRFYDALKDIEGDSTGEQRLARLSILVPFAERRSYVSGVLRATTAYLRGRRGGLLEIREKHEGEPGKIEAAITERRNADRSAFKLFLETLPRARQQMRRRSFAKRIARFIKVAGREDDEHELQRIDELTGLQVDTERALVNARGINLDDMRGEVQGCNLKSVDLTGAGLQRNDIKRVSFRGARLCEAQLEGSRLANCGIQAADFRAAYFGDPNDPRRTEDPAYTVFEKCVIDADTQFGNLPDNHPNAKRGMLDPARADDYRGDPYVILKDLCSDTLTPEEIIQVVHGWQRNGLKLMPGSSPEYFLSHS